MVEGLRIYNLFPLLAGPITAWKDHLPRIARMGFDWVYLNPFHYPGFSGSLYAVKDHYRLHPVFQGESRQSPKRQLATFVSAAQRHGLGVMMDLVINHTAKDCALVAEHPDWYVWGADGAVHSPRAVDPDDPSKVTVWGDLAEIDYAARPVRTDIVTYWQALARYYAEIGIRGFRCDAAYKVPGEVWREVIASARGVRMDAVFAAETLGCRPDEVSQLAVAGFDYIYNSSKWWDFRADWLLAQYETFRHIAPSIAFPESHDTERLVSELRAQGIRDRARIEAVYRQRYLFAATFSSGVMMPMGYEYGFAKRLDVVGTRPTDWESPAFDISDFVAEVNRAKAACAPLNEEGPQRRLDVGTPEVVALWRDAIDGTDGCLTLINSDAKTAHSVARTRLASALAERRLGDELTPGEQGMTKGGDIALAAAGIRLFRGVDASAAATSVIAPMPDAIGSRPIVIQNVAPEIDCGRYPAKREVGQHFAVCADIFREGHGRIAAVVKYRRDSDPAWRESPMHLVNEGLDRWCGDFVLEENTRYVYSVEAWPDAFASWRHEVGKKRDAGQNLDLELAEGRALVEAARTRASGDERARLQALLERLDDEPSTAERAAVLLSEPVAELMARVPDRSAAVAYARTLPLTVDRVGARFAAWYEMFPRSQGTEPGKGATFRDCIRRLPEVRDMGFDVVYLVPIHPIGRAHRKGPNNSLVAGPGDPGSPYAIGGAAGGHTAVHPELGTLDDFRAFVVACRAHGMEVALDFAIQCAPDHPWIKEHPDWFEFRPDGSIKYAENPPKKYQDIVNVNFYGADREGLWRALLDVVLFWVAHGVKIFRVDNPHTKPVPFWEWLIGSVQRAHPDVIFLSEAFTRPPMLKMLAKVGFTQSYTYFTWRNFKQELTDYARELTASECNEYLRPNFFANTPDILPAFLQTGGRAAFQIRLMLAATLSSVYGIYNGFELCENRAVPGTEEYLHSEKYEHKVWDWDRPGNIKDYVKRINRMRRDNPALHELKNLRFYDCVSEDVLFYGKMTADRRNMVFVAVNLDPFEAHDTEIIFPLTEMGVPEGEVFEVEELFTGEKHLWRGANQRLRLDPATNPAAVFRVTPWTHIEFREPCF